MAATQKVSIVDAMEEIQALGKPDWIKSCSQIAEHFTMYVSDKYHDCDELRIIFDRLVIFLILLDNQQPYTRGCQCWKGPQCFRYDVPFSLKIATQVSRQGGQDPIYYKIIDTTHIA